MRAAQPRSYIRHVALALVAFGAVLGLASAPFVLSASLVDVVGAGLGAITGAVLLGTGIVTLTIVSVSHGASRDAARR